MSADPARCAPRRDRQRGQALIEALVGLLALIPLLIALMWIGKLMAVRQSTIEASRYLAFECTARLALCADPDGQHRLADEVRERIFGRVEAPVSSDLRVQANPRSGQLSPMLGSVLGRPLLARVDDVGVALSTQRFDAGLSVAISAGGSQALALLADRAGPGRFGLAIDEGLSVATVRTRTMPLAANRMPLPGLQVAARAAVLTDAWTATGPAGSDGASVQSRVVRGAALPLGADAALDTAYLPVRGFIALMAGIGLEPRGSSFRYHRSDVDVVPADRLELSR